MHDDAARRCSLLRNIVVEREKPGEFVKVFRSFFADARKVSLDFPYFLWFFWLFYCYVEDLLLKLCAGGVSKREKREERWQEV
jgi:hypothetical protein